MAKAKKIVKCEGRFSQLRDYLYNEAFPVVLGDRSFVKEEDLEVVWELIGNDIFNFDWRDPYYNSREDKLRSNPGDNYLSLVPLVEAPSFRLDKDLVHKYALDMGNELELAAKLAEMGEHPSRFFESNLGREPGSVFLPGGKNFGGYVISGNFGIGTLSTGGVLGGGLRSDSPFLLEVYGSGKERGDINLAALIGFWAQGNNMLVSQLQSCRNSALPKEVPFGVSCLRLAEVAARDMGFKDITVYSARGHPLFKEHPEDWSQLGRSFTCLYDNSAKKLGYDGGRNAHHTKSLRQH